MLSVPVEVKVAAIKVLVLPLLVAAWCGLGTVIAVADVVESVQRAQRVLRQRDGRGAPLYL